LILWGAFFIFFSIEARAGGLIYNYRHYKYLGPIRHEYQKKNQCGSVTAGMILNYWLKIKKSQLEIGAVLRPHPDDKHILPEQLAEYLEKFGIKSKLLYSPDYALIKKFINNAIPVVVYQKTGLTGKLIGHYSIVRGYDDKKRVFITTDSYFGPNYRISYQKFLELWRPFGYFLMPVYPVQKEKTVEVIVEPLANQEKMLADLEKFVRSEIQKTPQSPDYYFNLGLIAFLRKDYPGATTYFEKAQELGLKTERILWYLNWPVAAYNEIKNPAKVFELTDLVFKSGNLAAAELIYERGRAFLTLNETKKARQEFQKSLQYEPNFNPASEALKQLET
jgi:tetratricopeptide (TPR) repeat protein